MSSSLPGERSDKAGSGGNLKLSRSQRLSWPFCGGDYSEARDKKQDHAEWQWDEHRWSESEGQTSRRHSILQVAGRRSARGRSPSQQTYAQFQKSAGGHCQDGQFNTTELLSNVTDLLVLIDTGDDEAIKVSNLADPIEFYLPIGSPFTGQVGCAGSTGTVTQAEPTCQSGTPTS